MWTGCLTIRRGDFLTIDPRSRARGTVYFQGSPQKPDCKGCLVCSNSLCGRFLIMGCGYNSKSERGERGVHEFRR